MNKYTIGIDFGTLSARAVLVDTASGRLCATATHPYKHGVIEGKLCTGTALPTGFALQHPEDYAEALSMTVSAVIRDSGIEPSEIASIGVDFTACTLLPLGKDMKPLCLDEKFKNNPHAYVKLWKHTSPQPEADEINSLANELFEKWISAYGGKLSSQFALPKILETLREAPEVYEATERFIEAGDYINLLLTSSESHSGALAGYKACLSVEGKYPCSNFLKKIDERLENIVGTKLSDKVLPATAVAGKVSPEGAALTGLNEGTVVSVALPDAHSAMPALSITSEGELLAVLGTSACYIINSEKRCDLKGICGYVKDGIIPGYYTYEAGQPAVGDILESFVKSSVPNSYFEEAEKKGIDIHSLLTEKASALSPGESRLLALDWQGGNRSVLTNSSLRGVIVGLSLNTRPEEIYRALIEATAFGAKIIVENYEQGGIAVKSLNAAGGIAAKNELFIQIYADVLEREIRVVDTDEAAALGSAIYASVAAGIFENIAAAAERIAPKTKKIYKPNPDACQIYRRLYSEYKALHDYFGIENKEIFDRI